MSEKPVFRKAAWSDLDDIVRIYDKSHDAEEAGLTTTGWLRDIYPVRPVAEASLERDDMYVAEEAGRVAATGVINQIQVDVYADGNWQHPAANSEIMVIHTLVISRKTDLKGLGSDFLAYYEAFALEHGCKYLRLDTNARNAAARAFYKRHGYTEIGIVPTVFNGIPGVDLVLIEKKLG